MKTKLSAVFTSGERTYVIAEMSANHNGSIERAEQIIRAMADSGADAVKLQTYTADTMTIPCNNEYFRIKGTLWDGRTLHDLYAEASTPWEWQSRLKAFSNELGMDCFSTPFDATAVDFLESIDVPCHKVASFELVDIPLLKKIASTKKPVIMSTGMGTLSEIDLAVKTLREHGTSEIALLKCTSAYPAPPEEANLRTIPHLAAAFDCPAGLSDHTMGSSVAVAGVAVGARIIEKHFTLSRSDGGPDGTFSMEPTEFAQMVRDIRTVERALGTICYDLTQKQRQSTVFRRSLFVVNDIKAGEAFSAENVRCIRPGYGLPPRYFDQILGRTARTDIARGTPLSWDLV
ncbi:N-acetylneuraminate synthase [Desulfocurvibacter africanus PCS]|uniref:N-acetylneuraminate synthase n=1 Tax=Desulfocurvibacter africanus PCS TaxID=1262666 RepID=M5Q2F4_DESAF|nr:pseudaminic acid synthase [Desulfocurvibacter africanus]EMG38406.1 N-acetylneuraminate synthase [Desulfocurvibacter africanus PCS]